MEQYSGGKAGDRETQAGRAFRLLVEALVRLDLQPGARVTERELAQRIGMGRTPVREAVQRLVSEGLLVVYPRKGMAISTIDLRDALLALDVRGPIERVVAVAAARRATPEQRDALRHAGEAMEQAAAANDMAGYMVGDREFDDILAASAANPFATRALAPLQTMTRRAWYFFRREPDLVAAAARHAAVAAAIASGNPQAAGEASDVLMENLRHGLKQSIEDL